MALLASELTTSSTPPSLPAAAPLSPMGPRTKSIGSISLVPTAGESSPTSILVDVTANCPAGEKELKRMQRYSDELFLPEEMIYENALIKVWSIEEEEPIGASNHSSSSSPSPMMRLQEEATYDKKAFDSLSRHEQTKERKTAVAETAPVTPVELRDTLDGLDIDSDSDMDDLFLTLPPTSIALRPRLSPSPLSPLAIDIDESHNSSGSTVSSESTNTVVLDASIHSLNLDEELMKPTRPSRGHRRNHRRNQSHFDFHFK